MKYYIHSIYINTYIHIQYNLPKFGRLKFSFKNLGHTSFSKLYYIFKINAENTRDYVIHIPFVIAFFSNVNILLSDNGTLNLEYVI